MQSSPTPELQRFNSLFGGVLCGNTCGNVPCALRKGILVQLACVVVAWQSKESMVS